MYSSDARVVRGVSIAVIILSSLTLAGGVVLLFFLGIGGAMLGNPDFVSHMPVVHSGSAYSGTLDQYASSQDLATIGALGTLSIGIASAVTIGFMLCAAVSLIAGIMGLRQSGQSGKPDAAFSWTIAGAIAAFITARWITAVLLVIMAVYLNRMKNPANTQTPPYYGQPYAPQEPPVPPEQR